MGLSGIANANDIYIQQIGTGNGLDLNITQDGVQLACGKGSVLLTELQRAGGKKMSAAQLAQTLGWKPGQVLN
mgnify:CR=1 FL=1